MGRPPFHPGDKIHDYIIAKEFTIGSLGVTYAIRGQDILLKAPFLDVGKSIDKFRREASILQKLQHPNIAGILDCDLESATPWILVKKWNEGTLRQALQSGPIPILTALRWMYQITQAMGYCHSLPEPVLHRRICPENICLCQMKPMILDLGITEFGSTSGVIFPNEADILYSAPEMFDWRNKLDTRGEVYSIGVIFYELLSGRLPFGSLGQVYDEENRMSVIEQIVNPQEPLPKITDLPKMLPRILQKSLHRMTGPRYANATAMCNDIRLVLRDVLLLESNRAESCGDLLTSANLLDESHALGLNEDVYTENYQRVTATQHAKVADFENQAKTFRSSMQGLLQLLQMQLSESLRKKILEECLGIEETPQSWQKLQDDLEILLQQLQPNLPKKFFTSYVNVIASISETLTPNIVSFNDQSGQPVIPVSQIPGQSAIPVSQIPGQPAIPVSQIPGQPAIPVSQIPGQPATMSFVSSPMQLAILPTQSSSQMPSSSLVSNNVVPNSIVLPIANTPTLPNVAMSSSNVMVTEVPIPTNVQSTIGATLLQADASVIQNAQPNISNDDIYKESKESPTISVADEAGTSVIHVPEHQVSSPKIMVQDPSYTPKIIISYDDYQDDDAPTLVLKSVEDDPIVQQTLAELAHETQTITKKNSRKPSLPSGFTWINDTRIKCHKDDSEMVYIPAGVFNMGSEAIHAFDVEKPEHEVYLDDYFFDVHLTTWKQYIRFCEDSGHPKPEPPEWGIIEDHPVVNITWEDAKSYCEWAGKVMPTEAQWEKAGRGGIWLDGDLNKQKMNPKPRRMYPWGDDSPNADGIWRANYNAEPKYGKNKGCQTTSPIGTFPEGQSPYAIMDMAGNVWEWIADWYAKDYYQNTPSHNPNGPNDPEPEDEDGAFGRVLRGGSWYIGSRLLRVTARRKRPFNGQGASLGMRCALVL